MSLFVQVPDSKSNTTFQLHYQIHGNGPMKLLFIGGLGATLQAWNNQIAHFGKDGGQFTSLVFDNRGAGLSDTPPGFYNTKQMAKDTEFLLNHVEWKSDIHLVGCSMGGMISQELALIDPTRFSSITLVSTHAGSLPPFEAVWKIPARFMIPTEIGKMKAFVKMLMHPSSLEKSAPEDWSPRHLLSRKNMSRHTSRLYLQKSKSSLSKSSSSSLQTANSSLRPYSSWTMLDKHIDDMLEMKSTVPPMSLKAFARQTAATFTHSVPPNRLAILKKYPDLRILVASGTLDRHVHTTNSTHLAKHLNTSVHIFQDKGHVVNIEAPEEFNEKIQEFILMKK